MSKSPRIHIISASLDWWDFKENFWFNEDLKESHLMHPVDALSPATEETLIHQGDL